jgi:hypothetical protein
VALEEGNVIVVIVREGGVYTDVRVFTSEENMNEAGFHREDMIGDEFPHFRVWITEVAVD